MGRAGRATHASGCASWPRCRLEVEAMGEAEVAVVAGAAALATAATGMVSTEPRSLAPPQHDRLSAAAALPHVATEIGKVGRAPVSLTAMFQRVTKRHDGGQVGEPAHRRATASTFVLLPAAPVDCRRHHHRRAFTTVSPVASAAAAAAATAVSQPLRPSGCFPPTLLPPPPQLLKRRGLRRTF